jgi:hypothetical protein
MNIGIVLFCVWLKTVSLPSLLNVLYNIKIRSLEHSSFVVLTKLKNPRAFYNVLTLSTPQIQENKEFYIRYQRLYFMTGPCQIEK